MDIFEKVFDITGKVAIVTGGSSGIGLGIAETLIEAGAKVAIVNRNSDAGHEAAARLQEHYREAKAFPADVSKKDEVEAMVKAVEEQMGPVYILVNSAGINIRKKAVEFDLDEWEHILAVNLTGTFLTCQTVGRRMIARRKGHIVNISSVASTKAMVDRAPYCASKAGVSHLTKVLAIEWAPYGVTVNAIGPGFTRTPLIAHIIKDPDFQKSLKTLVPLQRIGEPEDFAGIVLVLCSKAGEYITGQTFYVDGGFAIS